MSVAIRAERLGKQYRLGESETRGLLVERLAGMVSRRAPAPETFWALREVGFEVGQGQSLGLVGRNGAGKTTLLKLISRITRPTTGRLWTYGQVATLLEVGTGFHTELTGRENIFLGGSILGMKRRDIERRFDEIVEFSGVERFLDTPVKRYSSGMQVRLAFSVAAHLEPDILLVDEVLAVGDGEFQRKCLGAMRDVASEGRTVVFVSHNLHAVQRLCDRALLLDSGRIVMDDRPGRVVAEYSARVGLGHAGAADVADDAPRFGTGEVRIRRVEMLDPRGSVADAAYIDEPIALRITFEVFEPVPEATFEIGITSVDGGRLVTAQTIDGDRPPLALEPGVHEVTAHLDLTLLPNEYTVDLAVHTYTGITMDLLERVLRFTALNEARVGGDHYRWPKVRGFVRPDSTWTGPLPAVIEPPSPIRGDVQVRTERSPERG
jgi:lipopolysaccharide transport system ATP-binding protein